MMKRILLLVLVTCIQLGCGNPNAVSSDDAMKPILQDFGQFLVSTGYDGVKPPKKLQEFLPYEPMAPMAAEPLKDGRLVYYWGAGLKTGGSAIIAYEKDAESKGGWVLLEDNSVKKLTSEQFATASKAGKK
jgi:hypothetical protein